MFWVEHEEKNILPELTIKILVQLFKVRTLQISYSKNRNCHNESQHIRGSSHMKKNKKKHKTTDAQSVVKV